MPPPVTSRIVYELVFDSKNDINRHFGDCQEMLTQAIAEEAAPANVVTLTALLATLHQAQAAVDAVGAEISLRIDRDQDYH